MLSPEHGSKRQPRFCHETRKAGEDHKKENDCSAGVEGHDEVVESDNRELEPAVDQLVPRDPELEGRMWMLPPQGS
jgi:hypothetical protein